MTSAQIQSALADITAETDPTLKHLNPALAEDGGDEAGHLELVVVGDSAIEFYTEGAYVSGDLDLCVASSSQPLTILLRQELMGTLRGKGGPRSWEVAGIYVDVLGAFENLARTNIRGIAAPFGEVRVSPVEELIVERVLVSVYPSDYPPARECAKKILAAALQGEVETDWREVRRLAESSATKTGRK